MRASIASSTKEIRTAGVNRSTRHGVRPIYLHRLRMGFHDWFRLSVHAVITDAHGRVLLLKATYGERTWGLPGGALDPGETIHEGLERECEEELGSPPTVLYLSGVYSHLKVRSQAFIFRCALPDGAQLALSEEHSEFRYFEPEDLAPVQRQRVVECLHFDGKVRSARF